MKHVLRPGTNHYGWRFNSVFLLCVNMTSRAPLTEAKYFSENANTQQVRCLVFENYCTHLDLIIVPNPSSPEN
uniref:Uncharacterized protein n=1 Tax=Arundo donax TaxID=35708 RepID=A0A0A8ZAW5_ARUDO